MAAKVPDNVTNNSVTRINIGSRSLFIFDFLVADLDNNDTVDLSNYLSTVDAAWAQCTSSSNTSAFGIALSGTGNTTLTFTTAVDNLFYKLFVVGQP